MDRGTSEREQALKVKRIISQTKWQRRQRRLRRTPQHREPEQDPLADGQASSLSLPLPNPTKGTGVMASSTAYQDHPQLQIPEGYLDAFNEQIWSEPIYDSMLPAVSFLNQEGGLSASNQRLPRAATGIDIADMESIYASPESSAGMSASIPTSPRVFDANEISRDVQMETNAEALVPLAKSKLGASYYDSCFQRELTSGNHTGSSSILEKNLTPISPIFRHHASWPVRESKSILSGDMEEDALFMEYWDQVFYIQYPFYYSSNRQGRGWLFSILRRVKSAYHAALALTEIYELSTLPRQSGLNSSSDCLRAKGRHYDLALQEMQLNLARSHTWSLSHNIETLTCILQLVFWEVCLPLLNAVFNADIIHLKVIQWWETELANASGCGGYLSSNPCTSTYGFKSADCEKLKSRK
jgi:hypothetical protein